MRPLSSALFRRYCGPTALLARQATREVRINSSEAIQPGDNILVAVHLANRDPRIFKDADTFRLDRDFDKQARRVHSASSIPRLCLHARAREVLLFGWDYCVERHFDFSVLRQAHVGFGDGRHQCLGRNVARLQLKVTYYANWTWLRNRFVVVVQQPCNSHATAVQQPCNSHATAMQQPCNRR